MLEENDLSPVEILQDEQRQLRVLFPVHSAYAEPNESGVHYEVTVSYDDHRRVHDYMLPLIQEWAIEGFCIPVDLKGKEVLSPKTISPTFGRIEHAASFGRTLVETRNRYIAAITLQKLVSRKALIKKGPRLRRMTAHEEDVMSKAGLPFTRTESVIEGVTVPLSSNSSTQNTAGSSSENLNSSDEVRVQFKLRCLIGSARMCARIVKTASGFVSEVTISRGGASCNAKSIMGLMMLDVEGIGRETEFPARIVRIAASGPDAASAAGAILQLFPTDHSPERCAAPECNEWAVLLGPNETGGFRYRCTVLEKEHEWEVAPPASSRRQ